MEDQFLILLHQRETILTGGLMDFAARDIDQLSSAMIAKLDGFFAINPHMKPDASVLDMPILHVDAAPVVVMATAQFAFFLSNSIDRQQITIPLMCASLGRVRDAQVDTFDPTEIAILNLCFCGLTPFLLKAPYHPMARFSLCGEAMASTDQNSYYLLMARHAAEVLLDFYATYPA